MKNSNIIRMKRSLASVCVAVLASVTIAGPIAYADEYEDANAVSEENAAGENTTDAAMENAAEAENEAALDTENEAALEAENEAALENDYEGILAGVLAEFDGFSVSDDMPDFLSGGLVIDTAESFTGIDSEAIEAAAAEYMETVSAEATAEYEDYLSEGEAEESEEYDVFDATALQNLAKVASYISTNGTADSNGDMYISYSYSSDGNASLGRVTYSASSNLLLFTCATTLKSSGTAGTSFGVSLSTGTVVNGYVLSTYQLSSSYPKYTGKSYGMSMSYSSSSTLTFTVTCSSSASAYNTSSVISSVKSIMNSQQKINMTVNQANIYNKIGLKLGDLGFTSYDTTSSGGSSGSSTTTGYCEVEPNSSKATATKMVLNQLYQGEIGSYTKYKSDGEDVDWYAFDLVAGDTVRLCMYNYLEDFQSTTLIMTLYDPAGNEYSIGYDMRKSGNDYYDFTTTTAGTYYLKLYNYFDYSTKTEHPYKVGVFSAKSGGSSGSGSTTAPDTSSDMSNHWEYASGKAYWYEGGVKQGTYGDANGVVGDGTIRGREIYDPVSDGWYWLDAVYDGAKAVSKEVWMPYIYQDELNWGDDEINANAAASGDQSEQVKEAIKLHQNGGTAGKWVRYDANGKMYKGWLTISGDLATLYPSQSGNTYYYDPQTGLMAKGWVTISGRTYHFDENTGAKLN